MIRTIWATEYIKATRNVIDAAFMLGDTVETVLKSYAKLLDQECGKRASEWVTNTLGSEASVSFSCGKRYLPESPHGHGFGVLTRGDYPHSLQFPFDATDTGHAVSSIRDMFAYISAGPWHFLEKRSELDALCDEKARLVSEIVRLCDAGCGDNGSAASTTSTHGPFNPQCSELRKIPRNRPQAFKVLQPARPDFTHSLDHAAAQQLSINSGRYEPVATADGAEPNLSCPAALRCWRCGCRHCAMSSKTLR